MENCICVVFDLVAGEACSGIQMFKNETVAMRAWGEYCLTPEGTPKPHIKDQILIYLGTFNLDTLEIKQDRRTLITGAQFLTMMESQR